MIVSTWCTASRRRSTTSLGRKSSGIRSLRDARLRNSWVMGVASATVVERMGEVVLGWARDARDSQSTVSTEE
jgi:hypothetical protein